MRQDHSPMFYSREPIGLERAIELAPSIAAEPPQDSRSERYTFVPTARVLEGLIGKGFHIHGAMQSNTRISGKADFTKLMLRLRKPGNEDRAETPEIVLISSHDASCRYNVMAGMIRFACVNGLIVGDMWGCVKINHSSDIVGDVIKGAHKVVSQFDNVTEAADRMRLVHLSIDQQTTFVDAALGLRFGPPADDSETRYPLTVDQVLRPRRIADAGDDLWRVFNRAQENLTKGGLLGQRRDANGRTQRQRIREVVGIDDNVKLNRALWTLAERTVEQKLKDQLEGQLKSQLKSLMSRLEVEHKVERKIKTKSLMDID